MAERVEDIMEIIDRAIGPKKMGKDKAADFLEEIIDLSQARLEAIREEIANEEK